MTTVANISISTDISAVDTNMIQICHNVSVIRCGLYCLVHAECASFRIGNHAYMMKRMNLSDHRELLFEKIDYV